jgi:hypothetical protein
LNLNLNGVVAATAGNIWWWVLGIAVVVGLIWWWSAAGNRTRTATGQGDGDQGTQGAPDSAPQGDQPQGHGQG